MKEKKHYYYPHYKKNTAITEQYINQHWTFKKKGDEKWLPATVPGTVHTDLLNNGVIDDPFYRDNAKKQQWIEHEDWEYKTTFDVPETILKKDVVELSFEGLDTYAEVYLNGEHILTTDNMFRPWVADCKNILKSADNELYILFSSPIKKAKALFDAHEYELPANNDEGEKKVSIYTRKAPYHYGWDWCPRIVTSGIWRPVIIKAWNNAIIYSLRFVDQNISAEKAELTGIIEVMANQSFNAQYKILINGTEHAHGELKLIKGVNKTSVKVIIDNPRLWWPRGMGDPNLYEATIILMTSDNELDCISERIGLRTIELVREKDKVGKSFYFKINGHACFIRGTNMIPLDFFLPRVKNDQYQQAAVWMEKANMNMVRFWGGAAYENEHIYELCDEKGIMVWQDFMFACSMYPADQDYLESVKHEAIYNIKRLRRHPSLVVWCGNNEGHEGFHTWGWKEKLGEQNAIKAFAEYEKLFYQLLPDMVGHHDHQRPYWPSSPSSDFDGILNYQSGDYHYWAIIKEELPYAAYKENIARFMSEYGFKCYPELKTLETYTTAKDRENLRSEVMEYHQKWPTGVNLMEKNLKWHYNNPKDHFSFLYISQVLQAEAIKTAIEAHRRAKPYCMGSLYWMLNDCWPCASWSSVDYYGKWKALHYEICRSFKNLIVSTASENGSIKIYAISDLPVDQEVQLIIMLLDFSGNIKYEESMDINIPANSNTCVFKIPENKILQGNKKNNILLNNTLIHNNNVIHENNYYFVFPKDMALQAAMININISTEKKQIRVNLKSDTLAKNVFLKSSEPGFFADNYFDLLPGRLKTIVFYPDKAEDKKILIEAMSLENTY